jgi:hypothetical protein
MLRRSLAAPMAGADWRILLRELTFYTSGQQSERFQATRRATIAVGLQHLRTLLTIVMAGLDRK